MKSTAVWIVCAVFMLGESVNAWGGLFNRFSPEMLANMGYSAGGAGGGSGNSNAAPWYRVSANIGNSKWSIYRIKYRKFFYLT